MKSILSVVTLTVLSLATATVAFADEMTPTQILQKCKKEAISEEIPAADISAFMHQCLEDYGVEPAEIDTLLKEVLPGKKNTKGGK